MVSVVLPTYNGIQYLQQSVDSILNQTYSDFELIIVNDCSTDGTRELINELALKDSRIKTIHNESNKKLPASLNIGFSHAKGNFFTWTSDDNYYRHDAIEKMVQLLESNPQTDIVYADYNVINEYGSIVGKVEHKKTDHIYEDNIIGACFLYRSEVQDELKGYDENLFLVEDYDFWIRAYDKFNFIHLNESLYYYRQHGNSLTGTKMKEIIQVTSGVLLRVLNNTTLSEKDKIILLKRITKLIYNNDYNQYLLRHYMKMLKQISLSSYNDCGKEMILSQYLPKKFVNILWKIFNKMKNGK